MECLQDERDDCLASLETIKAENQALQTVNRQQADRIKELQGTLREVHSILHDETPSKHTTAT